MIINIRGTSGSGKSTAVRAIMALAEKVTPHFIAPEDFGGKKRKNPIFYRLEFPGHRDVVVLGHYGADCGGCDTLPTYAFIMDLVRQGHAAGDHVVYEGLLLSHDKKQTKALWEHLGRKDLVILEIAEDLETCLNSVRARRAAKGQAPEFNTENTVRRHAEVIRASAQLSEHGIPVHVCGRSTLVPMIMNRLSIPMKVADAA